MYQRVVDILKLIRQVAAAMRPIVVSTAVETVTWTRTASVADRRGAPPSTAVTVSA